MKEGQDHSEDVCVICLRQGRPKAAISGCAHVFCTPCIKRWSKRKARCPICRAKFHEIRTPSGTVPVRKPGRNRVQRRSSNLPGVSVYYIPFNINGVIVHCPVSVGGPLPCPPTFFIQQPEQQSVRYDQSH